MNYELQIQKSHPAVYNNLTGTRPPLVAGSGTSSVITSAFSTTFVAHGQGTENTTFSMEVWYLPITIAASSEIAVIGHASEGVLFNGTEFILRMKFSDSTQIEGRWTPDQFQNFHVVAIYNIKSYSLYVNGNLVITLDVPPGKLFASTTGTILLNALSAGTGTGWYDSLALYYRVLSQLEIQEHYGWAKDTLSSAQVSSAYLANTFDLVYSRVDVLQRFVFDSSNWTSGLPTNLNYSDNLVPQTGGGTWVTSIPLESISPTTTAGINLSATGKGFVLDWSTDGIAWTTAVNNRPILEDATTVGVMLLIRITIVDGGWVSRLAVDIMKTRKLSPFSGNRTLLFKGTNFDQTAGHQLDYQADQGAMVVNGYIEIQPDTDPTPTTVQSVEFWAKVDSASGRLLDTTGASISIVSDSYTFTSATVYRNGQAVTNGTFPEHEWAHYVVVFNAANNAALRIGNTLASGSPLSVSVGHIAAYPVALTAAQAAAIYSTNVGAPSLRIDDSGVLGVTHSATPVDIYAYTWTQ